MARMSPYRQKDFNHRIVLMFAGLIILVIFIATVGFNLLIKASVFVGNLGGNKQVEQSNDAFFGELNVDEPPTATNSAKVEVSGTISGFDTLDIEINNKRVKRLHDKTSFDETVGTLQKGQNTIEFIASSTDHKKETKKQSFDIQYQSEKPKLEIKDLTDGQKTSNTDFTVAGTTNPGVSIRVNGAPVVVDISGNFATSIKLNEGENQITIDATDQAGNVETQQYKIIREKD